MTPISWTKSAAIVGKYVFENSKKKMKKRFSRFNDSLYMQYELLYLLYNDYVMISAKKLFFNFFSNFRTHIFQQYRSNWPMIWVSFGSS